MSTQVRSGKKDFLNLHQWFLSGTVLTVLVCPWPLLESSEWCFLCQVRGFCYLPDVL